MSSCLCTVFGNGILNDSKMVLIAVLPRIRSKHPAVISKFLALISRKTGNRSHVLESFSWVLIFFRGAFFFSTILMLVPGCLELNIIQTRCPRFFFFCNTVLTPTHACTGHGESAASANVLSTSYRTMNPLRTAPFAVKNNMQGGSAWTRCSPQSRFRWALSQLQSWNLHLHVAAPWIPSYLLHFC